jgi:solute carrier family 25 oxoglutarate transporter 11
MGAFSYLVDVAKGDKKDVHISYKLAAGAVAGVMGSVVGNPAELALVRMADDSKLPKEQRRNYQSSLHACVRIVQQEGIPGLWRGVVNSSCRAAVLNSIQLGIYGPTKAKLVETQPHLFQTPTSMTTMFIGANISAFFAVGASMPLDVVKSRLMSMPIVKGQPPRYLGMVDCFSQMFKAEGLFVFWRGFVPAFVKLAPYTVISFTCLEKLTAKLTGGASAF